MLWSSVRWRLFRRVLLAVVVLAVLGWQVVVHRTAAPVYPVAGESLGTVLAPGMRPTVLTTADTHADIPTEGSTTIPGDAKGPIRILFGGDMMFDRSIRQAAMRHGNDFVWAPDVRTLMQGEEVVVANLEGPITRNASKSIGSAMGSRENYLFTFDPSWAQTLKQNNIGIVNIGNNHILNQGEAGLAETGKYLDAAGVQYFGSPQAGQNNRTLISIVQGVRIGFVNENQFVPDGEAKALEDVKALRGQVDVLAAYTHWGTEYEAATADEKRRAHALIDAGVDVVIGSHPHVVQEKEVYQGKTIYYSLGNFVFDQYWQEPTTHGLLIEMSIDVNSVGAVGAYHHTPLQFRDIQLQLKPTGQTIIFR